METSRLLQRGERWERKGGVLRRGGTWSKGVYLSWKSSEHIKRWWWRADKEEEAEASDWTGKKAEMWDYRRTQSGDGCTLEPQSQSPLMLHPCPWEPSVCVCVLSFYFILQLINTAVLFQVHSKVIQTIPIYAQTALCRDGWSWGFLELFSTLIEY